MIKFMIGAISLFLFAFGVFLVEKTEYATGGALTFGILAIVLYREFVSFIDTL